jgi:hypothetical protein
MITISYVSSLEISGIADIGLSLTTVEYVRPRSESARHGLYCAFSDRGRQTREKALRDTRTDGLAVDTNACLSAVRAEDAIIADHPIQTTTLLNSNARYPPRLLDRAYQKKRDGSSRPQVNLKRHFGLNGLQRWIGQSTRWVTRSLPLPPPRGRSRSPRSRLSGRRSREPRSR